MDWTDGLTFPVVTNIYFLRSSVNSIKHLQTMSKPAERPQSLKTTAGPAGLKTGGAVEVHSDSDAQQMLSFAMDDPDFESDELGVHKIKTVENHF